MINQTTLTLGGKERNLLFSSLGILEFIQEQTKRDPFEWLQELVKRTGADEAGVTKDILSTVKDIRIVIYGALNCSLDSRDEERIPFDKVNKWCTSLSETEYAEVFKLFALAIQNKEPGEVKAPESGA
jgi:hypothetical protein